MATVAFWTKKQLEKWDDDNQICTGEPVIAGWYYQLSDENAPVGPYGSQDRVNAVLATPSQPRIELRDELEQAFKLIQVRGNAAAYKIAGKMLEKLAKDTRA